MYITAIGDKKKKSEQCVSILRPSGRLLGWKNGSLPKGEKDSESNGPKLAASQTSWGHR